MTASFKRNPGLAAAQTDLSNGAFADLRGHRLKLWICGQIELVVPQELREAGTQIAAHFQYQNQLYWPNRWTNTTPIPKKLSLFVLISVEYMSKTKSPILFYVLTNSFWSVSLCDKKMWSKYSGSVSDTGSEMGSDFNLRTLTARSIDAKFIHPATTRAWRSMWRTFHH